MLSPCPKQSEFLWVNSSLTEAYIQVAILSTKQRPGSFGSNTAPKAGTSPAASKKLHKAGESLQSSPQLPDPLSRPGNQQISIQHAQSQIKV